MLDRYQKTRAGITLYINIRVYTVDTVYIYIFIIYLNMNTNLFITNGPVVALYIVLNIQIAFGTASVRIIIIW